MPAQQQTMTTAAAKGHLVLGWEDRDANLSETAHDLANLLQILSSSLSLMKREIEQPDRVRMRLATAMIGVDQCVSLSRALFVSPAVADDDAVMLQTLIGTLVPCSNWPLVPTSTSRLWRRPPRCGSMWSVPGWTALCSIS